MLLRDDQWKRIEPLLWAKASDCGVTGKNNRLFIEALLWICRTGAPWRDLPSEFGHWHTVYMRYNRWSKKGHWQRILKALGRRAQPEILDGRWLNNTSSPTCLPKKSSQEEEAIGKSRGGLSTKIHVAVGALGNPVRLILTAGQASQYSQAERLIQGFDADYVLADRGYDSDLFVEMIHTAGATAVIPPRGNRKQQRDYDQQISSRNSSNSDGLPLVTKDSSGITNLC